MKTRLTVTVQVSHDINEHGCRGSLRGKVLELLSLLEFDGPGQLVLEVRVGEEVVYSLADQAEDLPSAKVIPVLSGSLSEPEETDQDCWEMFA